MPTTTIKVELFLPCGEARTFKSNSMTTKWMHLHKKRCACCKGVQPISSVLHYKVRDEKKVSLQQECVKTFAEFDKNTGPFVPLKSPLS